MENNVHSDNEKEQFLEMETLNQTGKSNRNKDENNKIQFSEYNDFKETFVIKKTFYFIISEKIKKCFINIKNKLIENKKREITALILGIIAIILYILGLEGCKGDEVYCLTKIGISFYIKIITLNVISCICVIIILTNITFKKFSPLHILYLVPIFYILMIIDQGTNLNYHGYFNSRGYIAILILFYPFGLFIYILIKLIRQKKYRIYIPILAILFALFISFYIYAQRNNKCNNWDIGFNNTRIYNNENEYACQIKMPNVCYLNIIDGKLNFSNIFKRDCAKRNYKEKDNLFDKLKKFNNPYIKSNAKKIGYPHINKGDIPEEKQDGIKNMIAYAIQNFVDMDNLPPHITPEKVPEVYVDFNEYPDDPDSKYGRVHFNFKKNETLVEERKKKAEKNEVMFNNIIELFIDTLSRAHINRKLPKFKNWLEKFMKYDSEDFINYQFLKYHAVGVHTLLNFKPITFGESVLSQNGVNILNYIKEKGYITAQTDNYCSPEPYQVRQTFDMANVTHGYFDHELITLFCDPNYSNPGNPFPIDYGNCAIVRRCLYGLDTFDIIFNYSKLFWRTYKGNRRFLRLSSMDSHEATGELVKLMDDSLTDFMDDLYKNGDLNDTIIFLFSDHGNHMAIHLSILPTDDLEIEKIMPFFFILVPKKNKNYQNKYFLDKFYDNLYKNQQSLVFCYDIHDTIIHIIYNESDEKKFLFSKNGTSLFNRVDDKHRTCDDFPEIFEKKSSGTLTCSCIKNKNNLF